ncbi:MAG: hypothetical protein IPM69_02270 [Ignavibacteria bacterium]|nr:hypothetical protein [Ignavibacteria bacterium]
MFQRVVIFVFLLFCTIASAQQPSSPPPLELPDIVISGNEKVDIPAGTKQMPEKPKPLSKKELDSLNSLEKQPALLLSLGTLHDNLSKKKFSNGFLRGEFGQFISPVISGGYGIESGGYNLNALAGYASSTGHIDNAEFSKLNIHLNADYIAPDKYVFFGGSKTETTLDFNRKSYNLYALASAPERTTTDFSVKIGVNGDYNGFGYSAVGGWAGLGLSNTSGTISDNALNGHLSVQQQWNEAIVGARVMLDLHTFNGRAVNFMEAGGFGEYVVNNWTLKGILALQTANTSAGITQGGVSISGKAEYRLNPLFTFRGEVMSGLRNNSFREMILRNPYLSDSSEINFTRTHISSKVAMIYHPTEALALTAGVEYKIASNNPLMLSTMSGSFTPIYAEIAQLQIYSECAWTITSKDELSSAIAVTSARFTGESTASVPYIPAFLFTVIGEENGQNNLAHKLQ